MKKIIYFIPCLLFCISSSLAAVHIVGSSGLTFSPDSLTIFQGDTVNFSLPLIHSALEVSESSWTANDITPLDGGFHAPFGGGSVVPVGLGKHYYVCEAHGPMGMKGTITVIVPLPNTITINSLVDQDGSLATTGDQLGKNWSLKLYQGSIGSGIVLDSVVSGLSLTVSGLAAGTYVAVEADSTQWSHTSVNLDAVSQGATSVNHWTITVVSGESHTVDFINYAPHTIISSGFTFFPDSLNVLPGDIVHFVLDPMHKAREVSQATWLAEDTVSNGGFSLSFGCGTAVLTEAGTHYYVCVPHASIGMKGRIFVNDTLTVTNNLSARWNMISLPVGVIDPSVGAVYPSAVTSAYSYQSAYVSQTVLATGLGYWLKFGNAHSVSLHGVQISRDSIDVSQGWNMIGSISSPVPRTAITSLPGGIINSGFYGYNNGYHIFDTIKPGSGYWVKVSQSGKLILDKAAATQFPKSMEPYNIFLSANRLIFNDAANREQTLYFIDGNINSGDIRSLYELPPAPPAGGFDVRFASGSFVEALGTNGVSKSPIQISSAQYPITIRWNISSSMQDISLNIGGKKISLLRSGGITMGAADRSLSLDAASDDASPKVYALYQTFPNPFNPVTTIRYQLPIESQVHLKVYNLLGQLIATLVDGVQQAGVQSIVWNPETNASSGIYFLRLDAVALDKSGTSFVKINKVVLQK